MRSAVRLQENPDIFLEKGLSLRPGSDQGVATELAWRSIAFLRSSYWRLSALSRRFHCALNACTALSRRLHCADGVLKTFFCTTERSLRQFYVYSRK